MELLLPRAEQEWESRHIAWDPAEINWARNRPAQHRPPRPAPGDACLYRHDEWEEPVPARLIEWLDVDNTRDPNLYRFHVDDRSPARPPVVDGAGRHVMVPVDDPWPKGLFDTPYGRIVTREARVRGSAGWLPLDWRARWRPVPSPVRLAATPRPTGWRPVRNRPVRVTPSE